MRTIGFFGVALAFATTACAKGAATPPPRAPAPAADAADGPDDGAAIASDGPAASGSEPADASNAKTWIGAAAEGSMLSTETRETLLGVWVDVPDVRPEVRAPVEVALVIDTSGSMAGAKIDNARAAARTLLSSLHDGDIVALDTFSDDARTVVPPTRLDASSRAEILRAIQRLRVSGSTNMFDGLTLGEGQAAAAPPSHSIRRVVVVSDGIANVGPSSPDVLGALAARGLKNRVQVTSLGVGIDYDERTLDALAVKSSGRLYHLSEPKEMASILRNEIDLLNATLASDAFVEVVPAPGVQLEGADGIRADWAENRSLRIPLGALHAGQHREALVKVRIVDRAAFEGHARPLASVRLRFRDSQDGDLERIQEVVARAELTDDADAVARSVSSRTKAIAAIQETAQRQLAAAQHVNEGRFADADRELERAQKELEAQARMVKSEDAKKRLAAASGSIASARASTRALPSKPKSVQRDQALKMNARAMHDAGF